MEEGQFVSIGPDISIDEDDPMEESFVSVSANMSSEEVRQFFIEDAPRDDHLTMSYSFLSRLNNNHHIMNRDSYSFWMDLFLACFNGDIENVKLALTENRNGFNQEDSTGITPFYMACLNRHINVVKLLLSDKRIDINKADSNGTTPLSLVCQKNNIEIVKLLLSDERIDINKADILNSTPLYLSCYLGHVEIVKLLLNDVRILKNKPNNYGETPFFIACSQGQIEVVKLLVNDKESQVLLDMENEFGKIKLLINNQRVFLNKSNQDGRTPFFIACEKGHFEVVKLLLDNKRVKINKADDNGTTPFHVACQKGRIEIVKLLLKCDKVVEINNENKDGRTPLFIACTMGHLEIVRLLLDDRKSIITQEKKSQLLATACQNVHLGVVKLLLNHEGIDINHQLMYNSITTLYFACAFGHIEVVKHILAFERGSVSTNKRENTKNALNISRGRSKSIRKFDWETEEHFQIAKENCPKIVKLLESFQRNSNETKLKLRKEVKYCILFFSFSFHSFLKKKKINR